MQIYPIAFEWTVSLQGFFVQESLSILLKKNLNASFLIYTDRISCQELNDNHSLNFST